MKEDRNYQEAVASILIAQALWNLIAKQWRIYYDEGKTDNEITNIFLTSLNILFAGLIVSHASVYQVDREKFNVQLHEQLNNFKLLAHRDYDKLFGEDSK